MSGGTIVALVIFGLFLLMTGLLVGSILMMLKKSRSNKVDEVPNQEAPTESIKVDNRKTHEDEER